MSLFKAVVVLPLVFAETDWSISNLLSLHEKSLVLSSHEAAMGTKNAPQDSRVCACGFVFWPPDVERIQVIQPNCIHSLFVG